MTAFSIQGGGLTSQNSQGLGIQKDVMYTLNGVDRHATAVDCRNGAENEWTNGTLQAKSTGGIGVNF